MLVIPEGEVLGDACKLVATDINGQKFSSAGYLTQQQASVRSVIAQASVFGVEDGSQTLLPYLCLSAIAHYFEVGALCFRAII